MKILVLAGGSDQIALINKLKEHKHEIILVDYYQNPPAKNYADKHIIASTLDIEAVEEIAKTESVQLLTTACTDQALLTVAKVSENLSLPCYISYKTALEVTNKLFMKNKLLEYGIPTAKYRILDSLNPIELKSFNYPLVVKPVDCNSSKGVKKAFNELELQQYLTEAISLSRTKTAIVEEFKEGKELSVDFYIENGIAKLLSITGSSKIGNTNSFTIVQSYYPVVQEEEEGILLIGQKIATSSI